MVCAGIQLEIQATDPSEIEESVLRDKCTQARPSRARQRSEANPLTRRVTRRWGNERASAARPRPTHTWLPAKAGGKGK
jgi:hypothetical protein